MLNSTGPSEVKTATEWYSTKFPLSKDVCVGVARINPIDLRLIPLTIDKSKKAMSVCSVANAQNVVVFLASSFLYSFFFLFDRTLAFLQEILQEIGTGRLRMLDSCLFCIFAL